jgi:hypothetical protein
MMKRISNILLGIFVLPVCIGVASSLYESLSRITAMIYYQQKYFIMGGIAYLVVHTIVLKPSYLYILSHELMHAIAALISGGRVKSIKVSSKGGSVATTKSNIFIALSPYLFPFYTVLVYIIWLCASYFFKTNLNYSLFLFAVGFTLMFHIVLTIDFLKIRQTDLLHAGYPFSICLIFTINIICIALIFSLIFQNVTFPDFLEAAYINTRDIYANVFKQLFL